jgi:arsenite-transporting ATPase
MASAKDVLTDQALTAFFFVTLPESLPIAVITRFINWFHEFGIPVGGVVVNGLIQKEQVGENAADFVLNRVKMQEEHMGEIADIFKENVRAIVPLFETEVQGTPMLMRTMNQLFGA